MVLPLDKNNTGFANTGNYVNLVSRARAHLRSAGSKCHGLDGLWEVPLGDNSQSRSQRLHSFWSAPRMQDLWDVKNAGESKSDWLLFLPEVYEKEVSKQEIKILRMLLLDVFAHVRDGQWERNLKMGDAN